MQEKIGDKLNRIEVFCHEKMQSKEFHQVNAALFCDHLCEKNDNVDYQKILCYRRYLFEHILCGNKSFVQSYNIFANAFVSRPLNKGFKW